MTVQKKQPKQYNDAGAGDLRVNKVAYNKPVKKTVNQAWKLLEKNKKKLFLCCEGINRYLSGNGNAFLHQAISGTSVGSGSVNLPLHLFSISNVPNVVNSQFTQPPGLYYLTRTSAAGQMNFGSTNTWNQLTAPSTQLPSNNDVLKGVKIKMVLYGCLTRPTQYRIDLVQIMKPHMHPDWLIANGTMYSTTGTAGNNEQANNINAASAFYEELVRPYAFSPATFSNGDALKGNIKYLKSWYHTIQPRLTTEMADVSASNTMDTTVALPHSHVFDVWHSFNRSQKYDWERTVAKAENTGNAGDAPSIEIGGIRTDVCPQARIYLMVRAYNHIPGVNGQFDINCHTSYDYGLRTYHEALG